MQKISNKKFTYDGKKELEIYIHIPFCIRKCNYCDFLSAPADEKSRFVYIKALENEIAVKASACRDEYIVTSVFVGGGTPTVLDGDVLADLLTCIKRCFIVAETAEITFECNPGTADYEKLRKCKEAGYNRISIGLQSAIDDELMKLGRIHDYSAFVKTYENAVKCGFDNINVDLMSAIPGQSLQSLDESISRILALKPRPTHISSYSLILEEDTVFWKMNEEGNLELPDEDTERAMHWHVIDRLEKEGYLEYELSNLSLPGYECRHNVGYWIRKEYLGFGIGAASLFEGRRQTNTRDISEYVNFYADIDCTEDWYANKGNVSREKYEPPLSEDVELTREDEIEEFMFLGLRMCKGIEFNDFKALFDADISDIYGEIIDKNVEDGLLEKTADSIRLTRRGQDLANFVFSQFIL